MKNNFMKTCVYALAASMAVSPATAAPSSIVDKLFVPSGTGAVPRTINIKMADYLRSVRDFGAKGDGVTNDTAAFTKARTATGGRYFVPNGVFVVDAAPDVFGDSFKAGDAASIKIGAKIYNVSDSFSGALKHVTLSPVQTAVVHAKTGNTIMAFQDGSPGTATYFYRGLAFNTDGHFIQAKPKTAGGATDILFQRSAANADSNGNRFNFTFEENNDTLIFSHATTARGFPSFDSFMQAIAGPSPSLLFPAVRPKFQQGWTVQTRALGALKLSLVPGATVHKLTDETSGNVVAKYKRSSVEIGGLNFNTLADTPSFSDGPQRWGGTFGDLKQASSTLPVTKNLVALTGANNYAVIGTLRAAAVTSGGKKAWRETRITYDGTSLILTDLVNTFPVQIVATVAMSGTNMQFQGSYAGGLGAGISMSVSLEWNSVGR